MPISNPIRLILDRRMVKELSVQTNNIVEKARENVSWSKTIPYAISSTEARKAESGYESSIVLDLQKAPQAAAFEYGSGEHGESGETYTIEGMPWLAIPRERWPKYAPPLNVDPVVLHSVEHPGVEAKPYLQPAIDAARSGLVTSLARTFKQSYLESTVKVEIISAKK